MKKTNEVRRGPADTRKTDRDEAIFLGLSQKKLIMICCGVTAIIIALIIIIVTAGRLRTVKAYDESFAAAMECYIAGEYEDAIGHLEDAAAINNTEECSVLAARCRAGMGDYATAVSILEKWLTGHESDEADALLTEYRETLRELNDDSLLIAGQRVKPDADAVNLKDKALTAEDIALIATLDGLKSLNLSNCGLGSARDLAGLGSLTSLILTDNRITDLSPLSALTNLETLYLDGNPDMGALTPLYALKQLAVLNIKGRTITDVELEELQKALPDCTVLCDEPEIQVLDLTLGGVSFKSDATELYLADKGITDISVLAKCTELTVLDLSGNSVVDLTPLLDMQRLTWLDIGGNRVSDLSPLMSLTKLEYLDAENNAFTRITALTTLINLKELWLSGNKLGSVSPVAGLGRLEKLGLQGVGVTDSDLVAISGLSALRELNIKDNADITGAAVDSLKQKLSSCTVHHSELKYKIKLGTAEFMSDVTSADASGKGVSDLSEALRFTKLSSLLLNDNAITDISTLSVLTTLTTLELRNNRLADIGPVAQLTVLKKLDVSGNSVIDLSPLRFCTSLEELHLGGNAGISDLSSLALFRHLTTLTLSNTGVTDISALSGLITLTKLELEGCALTDVTPLYGLSALRTLNVHNCGLTDEQLIELRDALPDCSIYS